MSSSSHCDLSLLPRCPSFYSSLFYCCRCPLSLPTSSQWMFGFSPAQIVFLSYTAILSTAFLSINPSVKFSRLLSSLLLRSSPFFSLLLSARHLSSLSFSPDKWPANLSFCQFLLIDLFFTSFPSFLLVPLHPILILFISLSKRLEVIR